MNNTKVNLNIFIFIFNFFFIKFVFGSDLSALNKLQITNFFKDLKTIEANFIQVGPSGNISNGKVYFDFPGKIRIDYEKPNDLLITSKGYWLVIQNRKLKSTNNILLKNSPFSTLLEKKIFEKNNNINIKLEKSSGILSLKIINSDYNLGKLILQFSEKPFAFKKWIVEDPIGLRTTVLIQNATYNNKLSHLLFFPEEYDESNSLE